MLPVPYHTILNVKYLAKSLQLRYCKYVLVTNYLRASSTLDLFQKTRLVQWKKLHYNNNKTIKINGSFCLLYSVNWIVFISKVIVDALFYGTKILHQRSRLQYVLSLSSILYAYILAFYRLIKSIEFYFVVRCKYRIRFCGGQSNITLLSVMSGAVHC